MRRPSRACELRDKQELGGEHLSWTEGPSEGCSCICLVALQRLSVPGPPEGQLPLQRAGAAHRVAVTEEALYNHCENDAGNGPHIHLGETNTLDFIEDGDCLRTTANDTFPADMEGLHDGTEFELEGSFIDEWGTCELQVDATFAATLTDADSFTYTFHLKVTDLNDYCAVGVGETDAHTYKQLPCELSWTGTATRD